MCFGIHFRHGIVLKEQGQKEEQEQDQTESQGPQTSKSVYSGRLLVCTGEK